MKIFYVSGYSSWRIHKLKTCVFTVYRDASKRAPNDENYDPRTLYVPETYIKSVTPGLRQWWILKSQHFDTMFLFKVSFELFVLN